MAIIDYRSLLSQLTLEEKVALLSGKNFTTAAGVSRLSIPPIKVADGINGVRPSQHDSDMTTACFPNTTCLGSTWDAELLGRMGERLADQARMKNAQVVLGPTINIHRDPRAGRNFECFSEDPLLSGQLAGAIVNGIQKQGVGACPKHLVCNDSEYLRHYYNVQESVDSRTLREIYLAAWQHMLRVSDPVGVMTAYNKVDGDFCSANHALIEGVLRKQWGYKGIAMSDWFGTHDTVGPIKAGLDLEMPFPVFRAGKLVEAVRSGDATEENIDYRVSKMLELRNRLRRCLEQVPERSEIDERTNQTARELAAGGIVLLKNDNDTLPLRSFNDTKIAVIGEFAQHAVVTGGGSASCNPQYRHAPLKLLQEMSTNPGNIRYAAGVRTRRIIPLAPIELLTSQDGRKGIDIVYFNDDSTEPVFTEFRDKSEMWMLGQFKPGLKVPGSHVEITTRLTPLSTGKHLLAVRCTGSFVLSVDGEPVMTGPQADVSTEQFLFNHILSESRTWLSMEAGRPYDVKLVMKSRDKLMIGEPTPYAASLCFEEYYSEEAAIAEAVELAKASDMSIIFAGRDGQHESEGFDLEDIRMPANQTALIKAVAAASKKTVLVMHCGNPIDVSAFVEDVDAVLNAHFPGQEGSRAIADILTGSVCPSGRLTTTWFKTIQDAPSFGNFPATRKEDGSIVMRYAEGLKMGYRQPEPERVRWPFGFGMSYTSFSYGDLVATVEEDDLVPKIQCSVRVTNTGSVPGHEVIQLFVTPAKTTLAWRPEMELKAFAKVYLQPGESAAVPLDMDLQVACSYWDEEEKAWRLDAGTYGVVVGTCRADISVTKGSLWNHL